MDTTILSKVMASLPSVTAGSSEAETFSPPSPQISTPIVLPSERENPKFREKLFNLDESHHDKVALLGRFGEWFLRMAINNQRLKGTALVLSGPPGCGKTHVLNRIERQLRCYGVDCCVSTWKGRFPHVYSDDWTLIAQTPMFDTHHMDEIKRAEIVMIDDVGSEVDKYKSGEPTSRLRQILSLCDDKFLLLTTNLTKTAFFERYDARVADRLQAAHWCDMTGVPSYRSKTKT